ncbi:hypothetical protein J3459_011355 [Metarhizium acridum]|nr:hypothetical protein J3459_011355 [Metarhizium acridum]
MLAMLVLQGKVGLALGFFQVPVVEKALTGVRVMQVPTELEVVVCGSRIIVGKGTWAQGTGALMMSYPTCKYLQLGCTQMGSTTPLLWATGNAAEPSSDSSV